MTSLGVLIALGSLTTAICWLLMPWPPGPIDFVGAELQEEVRRRWRAQWASAVVGPVAFVFFVCLPHFVLGK